MSNIPLKTGPLKGPLLETAPSTINTSANTSPYASFKQAQQNIAGIEAIDYFFAKELSASMNCAEPALLFHLLLALSESLRNGHSCLPLNAIAGQCYGYASDDTGVVLQHGYLLPTTAQLDNVLQALNIKADHQEIIVYHHDALYMRRYFQFEHELCQSISAKNNANEHIQSFNNEQIGECIASLFPPTTETEKSDNEIQEIDWQKVAVANAINKNFCIIAGGPGTGKTYTVTKLLAALVMLHSHSSMKKPLTMALVAPTGKAAQRLSESVINAISGFKEQIDEHILEQIPVEAQTLHRLLGVIPNSPNFRFHQDNLLDVDVLLIDEVSMVDLAMMTRVFRALPKHCKVILLGDADQLPSVSVGSVLADLASRPHLGYSRDNIEYLTQVTGTIFAKDILYKNKTKLKKQGGADHVTFLSKSRRFDDAGGIGKIASAVIQGNAKTSWQLLKESATDSQLTLLTDDTSSWLAPLVDKYYYPLFACTQVEQAFSLLLKFRVLCATRQGKQGVEQVNEHIRSILFAQLNRPLPNGIYHGQPIMINQNDYRLGLYNGDIGIIWSNEAGHLMAVFEDSVQQTKWIMPSRLPQFESVYAMTIHKTQGSEFEHVALLLPNQKDNRLLSRELLYTGITRAKEKLSIAATANVWRQGVESQVIRYSGLELD